jgi:hypothetical protein
VHIYIVVPVRELSPHHDIDPERDPDPPVADLDYEIDRPLGYEISLPNGIGYEISRLKGV